MEKQDLRKDTYLPEILPKLRSSHGSFIRRAEPMWVSPLPRLIMHSHSFEYAIALSLREQWQIGRRAGNDIVVPDRWISREHAQLFSSSSGEFTLRDLGSHNGSFINNRRVTNQETLHHGDRLFMGFTDFSFHNLTPQGFNYWANATKRQLIVALAQSAKDQGEIWREVLNSQGFSTLWVASGIKPTQMVNELEALGQPRPDLLLIDIGCCDQNPYDFCEWSRKAYPDLPIIFTTHTRTEVLDAEQKWAIAQGAANLFPAFDQQTLKSDLVEIAERVSIMSQILGHPFQPNSESLHLTLSGLQNRFQPEPCY